MNNAPWTSADFSYSQKFEYLASLQSGWLDNLNPPVSHQALVTAYCVLSTIDTYLDTQPSIVPTAEGGIAIEDKKTGLDLEVDAHGEIFVIFFNENSDILDSKVTFNPQVAIEFITDFKL